MNTAHQTGKVLSGDINIFYRRFGVPGAASNATPVIIVHGLSFFSYDWIPVASQLAQGREVVAMDMRGFGDSDWSASRDYTVPAMAGDIIALADALGWDQFMLLGHSMGGRTSAYCASKFPDRVKKLVLLDYSPQLDPVGSQRVTQAVGLQPDVFESVDAAMTYFGVDPGSEKGRLVRPRHEAYLRKVDGGYQVKRDLHFRDQFKRVLETGQGSNRGIDMWQVLSEISCPVLSVRGKRSDMFASEMVPRIKAANAAIEVVEIDAGHDLAGDNPTAMIAAITPFIS